MKDRLRKAISRLDKARNPGPPVDTGACCEMISGNLYVCSQKTEDACFGKFHGPHTKCLHNQNYFKDEECNFIHPEIPKNER